MSYNNNLNNDIERQIGKELNIPMWSSLTLEEKDNILKNSRDSAPADYYQCLIIKSEEPKPNLMNIISYDPYCGLLSRGTNAIYTLNLKTKKPTKKSHIQIKLSEELCNKIIESKSYLQENNTIPNTYIKSMNANNEWEGMGVFADRS